LDRLAASIRKNESSGNYANVTTTTNPRTGQRQSAIGAYGIMDFNVGPWTREVLGQAMTPQQFLSSPGAQDAVAKAKLGQYASKYGLSGAARAWIGGEGNMYGSAPDAFGTTPSAYAARVTRDMGLPPEITQGRSAGTAPGTEGQAMGLSAPPSVAAGPGVAQLAQNTGQFGGITRDQLVQLARNPVTADLARQIVARQISPEMKIEKITDAEGVEHLIRVPVQGPAGDVSAGMLGAGTQGAESPETAGLTGEDYLKTLDSGRANLVKAIAEGRSPMPSLSAKSPQVRSLARDVMRYEPGMDSALWRARNTAYTSATSGKIAQNYASFETALSHINQLDSRIDALNNSNIQPWNAAANRVKRQYDPNLDTALKQFEIDKNAAVAELTRAFRGTGGNVHDLKEWEDTLSSAGSPQALHAAIREGVELLRGRMEAVSDEYNRAMQSKVPIGPDALLEPKYKEIFNRLGSISVTPKGGPTITEERPQTVIQNGHTYTRQPDGSYK
jgi:hypothetical protein